MSSSRSPIAASSEADLSENTWTHVGDLVVLDVWGVANRAKDRQDEVLDAMRVSNGMTLDQFLESTARK